MPTILWIAVILGALVIIDTFIVVWFWRYRGEMKRREQQ